jgi:hypothetical protein
VADEQSCGCPETWPKWDGTDQNLAGKCVHRMSIAAFFHMPLAYETYLAKQYENIQQLELTEIWPGFVLTRTGMIGGEMIRFIEDAESASRFVQYLSPPFDVNVMMHEGGIGTIQKTLQAQQMRLVDAGRTPKEVYLAHLTCPVCEKRKGGEQIMVVRRWIANARLQSRLQSRKK